MIQRYEVWGSDICVAEDSNRLGCDAGLQMVHSRRFQWTKSLRRQGVKVNPYWPAWPLTIKALPPFEASRNTHNNWRLDTASLNNRRNNDVVEDWRSSPIGLLDPWLRRHYLPSKHFLTPTKTDALIRRSYTTVGTKTPATKVVKQSSRYSQIR